MLYFRFPGYLLRYVHVALFSQKLFLAVAALKSSTAEKNFGCGRLVSIKKMAVEKLKSHFGCGICTDSPIKPQRVSPGYKIADIVLSKFYLLIHEKYFLVNLIKLYVLISYLIVASCSFLFQ